jgi:hypothetical protein
LRWTNLLKDRGVGRVFRAHLRDECRRNYSTTSVNQFNRFITYLWEPRARATPPRLGGTPRHPVPGVGGPKSTSWGLDRDGRRKRDAAAPRSGPHRSIRSARHSLCAPVTPTRRRSRAVRRLLFPARPRRADCNLSLSRILFALAKEVSHFGLETGQSRRSRRDFLRR